MFNRTEIEDQIFARVGDFSQKERTMLLRFLKTYEGAKRKHGPFGTPEQAYGVILEELDEAWDCIKAHSGEGTLLAEMQAVPAMAFRFMVDLC